MQKQENTTYLKAITIRDIGVANVIEQYWQHINERYEMYCHDVERPILQPDNLFINLQEFTNDIEKTRNIVWQKFEFESDGIQESE